MGTFLKSRTGAALIVFVVLASLLLILEHRAHIPGNYWLLGGFLVLCLLMHGFMHGGHGKGGHGGHGASGDDEPSNKGSR